MRFVFAFTAIPAVNARLGHHTPLRVAGAALSAVLLDVDHILFAYNRAFHTVFVTILLPLVLFYIAYRYERGRDTIQYQSLSLLLLVMLVGHVVADLFAGGAIRPFYPLSMMDIQLSTSISASVIQERWLLYSSQGIALTVYAAIIGLAYYTEAFIDRFERGQETLEETVRSALRA